MTSKVLSSAVQNPGAPLGIKIRFPHPTPDWDMEKMVMCIILDHLSYNTVRESRTVCPGGILCARAARWLGVCRHDADEPWTIISFAVPR